MKAVGEVVDLDFEVQAAVAGERWRGLMRDLVARRTLVSVYMKNNTKVCDSQMAELERARLELGVMGWGVVGLSKDSVGSHLKYAGRLGLGFPLVADGKQQFSQALEAMVLKMMYGREYWGASRSAYALDGEGRLLGVVERVEAGRDGEQLRELAGKLGGTA